MIGWSILLIIISVPLAVCLTALTVLPQNRKPQDNDWFGKMRIWVWKKQDVLIDFLKKKESRLNKKSKIISLVIFCITCCLFIIFFGNYPSNKDDLFFTNNPKKPTISSNKIDTSPKSKADTNIILNEKDFENLKKIKNRKYIDTTIGTSKIR